jgi:hypothetical protein
LPQLRQDANTLAEHLGMGEGEHTLFAVAQRLVSSFSLVRTTRLAT